MPINKFKIVSLPAKASIEINGLPAVLDQEYPISKQDEMDIQTFGVGVPYDSFTYRLGSDDNQWSREILGTINVNVDSGTPAASGHNIDVDSNATTDISGTVTFDQYTDRIQFPEPGSFVKQYGYIQINGDMVRYGVVYMIDDITSIEFVSTNAGSVQNAVTTVAIQYGNKDGYSASANLVFTGKGNMIDTIETNSTESATLTTVP